MRLALSRSTHGVTPSDRGGALLRLLGAVYLFATPLDFVPSSVGTPATMAGLLFLAQWLIYRGAIPRAPLPKALTIPLILALAAWSAVTSIWSFNPGVSLTQTITVALLGFSAVAIADTFRANIRVPAWALMLGAGVAAAATLISGPGPAGPYGVASEEATFLGIDPNALAFHLCLGLAASFFLIITEFRLLSRAIAFGLVLLLAAAILAVGSRTGGGTLVLSSILFVILSARTIRTALAGGVLLLALAWVLRVMAQSGVLPARLLSWYQEPVLMDNRELIIDQYWKARSAWIIKGVGAGADADFLYQTRNWYKNAHSAFWKTWIELGAIGLLLWGAMLANLTYHAVKSTNRLLFALALPAVTAFFYTLGPLNSNMLWALFGLALGASPNYVSRVPAKEPIVV